jgi:serine/threonine protein kinase/Tfp pilus assembly protein PilF
MKCPQCQHKNPANTAFCGRCGASLLGGTQNRPPATMTIKIPILELAIGSTFAGRYQVLENLGKGGMGQVYKVLDQEINEVVALKILGPAISGDEEFIKRFHNELKLARRISHKNVCGLYHLSRDEDGTNYITMEFVPGEDLKSLIRRVGQLTIRKSISIAGQVCSGLAEAHRLGIVHRDLKPQNIMIDHQGNVRIMDFGIAFSLIGRRVTEIPMMIGTPSYMSPEQVDGKEVDARADIYALGVILFEMLTGRLPFEGDTPLAMAMKQKAQAPEPPRLLNAQVSESLNSVVLRCLEKNMEKRYQNVEELLTELVRVRGAEREEAASIKERKTAKIASAIRTRYRSAAILIAALIISAAGWLLGKRLVGPKTAYDNYISVEFSSPGSPNIRGDEIEYLLLRSLMASTRWNVFVRKDILTYKKQTESNGVTFRPAMLQISGEVQPKITGFDIQLTLRRRNKSFHRVFDCKGQFDFLTERINDIQSFLASQSEGIIGPIEGNRSIGEITTPSLDAFDHFLKGEEAWGKLDSDTAFFEYRTALENDPAFSLAHLRLADVLVFRSDREEARDHLSQALTQKDRLIELDLLRLHALQARLDSRPSDERQYLGKLIEEFPFRKEYHYEFAESYFHCGNAEEAIKHYKKALELDDQYSLAHNHIAFCYSWIGDHERAMEHFLRYQALDHSANSLDSLASGYMFLGDCRRALSVLEEGIEVSPKLDYLFGNTARNYILLGSLKSAEEAVLRQAEVTIREFIRMDSSFWLAYIELQGGNSKECQRLLDPVLRFYSGELYQNRLDEAPNLPIWLAGVLAAMDGDKAKLQEMIAELEGKIKRNNVSVTNFFPVFKFYIHLKALEAELFQDLNTLMSYLDEGRRIRSKMGYWGSFFNLPYFFSQYADILLKMNQLDEAEAVLNDANQYNGQYAATHLGLAEVCLRRDDREGARREYEKAAELLSSADSDFVLARTLADMKRRIS